MKYMPTSAVLLLASILALTSLSRLRADEPLDVNDISFLWPVPKTTDDVSKLIAADVEVDGGPLWPKSAFDAVLKAGPNVTFPRGSGIDPFRIEIPPELGSPAAWKVAAIRFDASAPGSHSDLIARFGSTPQIRLILQPVTGQPPRVRDFAAHLVFDFLTPPNAESPQRANPDRERFGQIVDELRQIRQAAIEAGAPTRGPLTIHPGLLHDVPAVREKLIALLKHHLSESRLRAISFMGIDGREPWIFFAMARSKSDGSMNLVAPPSIQPALGQMLSFRGLDRVQPRPNLLGHKVSTAMLFDDSVRTRLDERVSTDEGAPQFRDVPAIIANPQIAHFFNTDCVSCHSESTRRSKLAITDQSSFAFERPEGVSGVDPAMLPDDGWNVRNFGWGVPLSGEQLPTVSMRAANETAESVAFINKEYGQDGAGESQHVIASDGVAHGLTLIVTAKSESDYTELKGLIKNLQNDPASPIKSALDRIGIVHDARFVFFDDQQQLAIITTFDDDFDVYIDLFVQDVGQIFDAILAHVKDAPPLPVAEHADEFHDFVRKHNHELEPPIYSAYPNLRVSDILRLERDQESTNDSH
jgi:hypothetical protein